MIKANLSQLQQQIFKQCKFKFNKEIKCRDDFDSEEKYLIYLATDPYVGVRTKTIAKTKLKQELELAKAS